MSNCQPRSGCGTFSGGDKAVTAPETARLKLFAGDKNSRWFVQNSKYLPFFTNSKLQQDACSSRSAYAMRHAGD